MIVSKSKRQKILLYKKLTNYTYEQGHYLH